MNTRARLMLAILSAANLICARPAIAAPPPPELVELERKVSLQLAHVRDSGPTDPVKRQQLFDANQLEQKGEAQIKSGDYESAHDSLIRARTLLLQLSD